MTDSEDLGIVDALAQLSFLLQETLAKHASASEVSMIQLRLLGVLRDRKPTMQELATFLRLDKSSITGLVDRAEKRGLVTRVQATDDRRSMQVSLTPAGRRTVRKVAANFAADVADLTSGLPKVEQKKLSTLATKIVSDAAR